jgi:hypothetical protein
MRTGRRLWEIWFCNGDCLVKFKKTKLYAIAETTTTTTTTNFLLPKRSRWPNYYKGHCNGGSAPGHTNRLIWRRNRRAQWLYRLYLG